MLSSKCGTLQRPTLLLHHRPSLLQSHRPPRPLHPQLQPPPLLRLPLILPLLMRPHLSLPVLILRFQLLWMTILLGPRNRRRTALLPRLMLLMLMQLHRRWLLWTTASKSPSLNPRRLRPYGSSRTQSSEVGSSCHRQCSHCTSRGQSD